MDKITTFLIDGKKLKEVRESRKISASKFAKLLGDETTVENVYAWERGHQPMSAAMRKKVLDWMDNPVKKIPKTNGVASNGSVPYSEDWQKKYYTLLEKYTALLEKK